jgi:hypothetical protein
VYLAPTFSFGQIPFRTNSGWTFYNESKPEKSLYNGEFEAIEPLTDELFVFTRKGSSAYKALVTKDGNNLTQSKYAAFRKLTDELIAFTEMGTYNSIQGDIVGGKWGVMDKTGTIVLPAAYHQIQATNARFFIVQMNDNWGPWGVIDHKGNWVEKPVYQTKSFDMRPHSSIYFVDDQNILIDAGENVWKIKNLYTKKVVTLKSDDPWGPWFNEGVGVVFFGENDSHVIDVQGKIIIPKGIATFSAPQAGLIVGENKLTRKIYLYSKVGKKIQEMKGELVSDFTAGFGVYKNEGTWYVFNENGKVVLSDSKEIKLVASYGFAAVKVEDKTYQLVDLKTGGTYQLPAGYSVESAFSEQGLAVVKNEKSDGIYDFKAGKFTVPCSYWDISHWKGDYFKVRFSYNQHAYIHGRTGFTFFDLKKTYEIDTWKGKSELRDALTQELIFEEKFEEIQAVYNNDSLFIAKNETGSYVLNAHQASSVGPYDAITASRKNFIVAKNSKQGIVSFSLQEVVPVDFQKVEVYVTNSYAENDADKKILFIVQNRRFGVLNETGKVLLDTVYRLIPTVTHGFLVAKRIEHGYNQDCSLVDKDGKIVQEAEHALSIRLISDTDWLEIQKPSGSSFLYQISTGKILTLAEGIQVYRKVSNVFSDTTYFFFKQNGKFGIMNDRNQVLVPAKDYDFLSDNSWDLQFLSGKKGALVVVTRIKNWELKKVEGIELIQKHGTSEWTERKKSRYALKENGSVYMVNKNLEKVDGIAYKKIFSGNTHIIAQNKTGKYGLINQLGEKLISFDYENVGEVDSWMMDGLLKDGYLHLFNIDGKEIFSSIKIKKLIYREFSDESGIYQVETSDGKKLIDFATEEIILEGFSNTTFDEELFYYESEYSYFSILIKTEKGFGLYSLKNKKYTLEPIYEKISLIFHYPSESTILLVKEKGMYNFYDLRMNEFALTTPASKLINDYNKEDVIMCITNDSLTFVAKTFDTPSFSAIRTGLKIDKYKVSLNYDLIWKGNSNPVIQIEKNKKIGLLTFKGVLIHDVSLDDFDYTIEDDTYMLVRKGGLQYIIRVDGTYVTEKGFDAIDFSFDDSYVASGTIGDVSYKILNNGELLQNK